MGKTCLTILHAAVAIVFTATITGVESRDFLTDPQRCHLDGSGGNMTIVCSYFEPITACQFSFIYGRNIRAGPILDVSQGVYSEEDPDVLNSYVWHYKYFGSGLDDGVCGITLELDKGSLYVAGCRTRTATSGWRYATMGFEADESRRAEAKVTPNVAVALPRSDVHILCEAPRALGLCSFALPRKGFTNYIFLEKEDDLPKPNSQYWYRGAGLSTGECGITLRSVSEGDNGFAWCGMYSNRSTEMSLVPVIIAQAPKQPQLEIKSQVLFEGVELQATCTVTGGRPVPNITWYLGEQVLRQDSLNDVAGTDWAWPTSIQTITQTLKHRLVAADSGLELRCQAAHVALPRPLFAAHVLTFSNTTCPPLTSNTMLITCTLGTNNLDCGKSLPVGTVASLQCKKDFKKLDRVVHNKTTCIGEGSWNKVLFKCIPDCGRRITNSGVPLIHGGKNTLALEFPWHVAIYDRRDGTFIQICGGTLVSAQVVISAAHCFWNERNSKKESPSAFKVAAGKLLRSWEDSDPNVQIRDVAEVRLKDAYGGRLSFFSSDIAIVRLTRPFDLTGAVSVACFGRQNRLDRNQLNDGNMGEVAGWGYTEDGVPSDSLKYVEMPYIPDNKCLENLSFDLKSLLTVDKFCAGFNNNNTSVCRGDSGGGLVFRHPGSNRYYLRGIVSVAFVPANYSGNCYYQYYTAFTKVSTYYHWIIENID